MAARKFRRAMSLPEVLLWQRVRGSPGGVKFRRPHAIGPYVVDFCASATRLAVEVDGKVHDDRSGRDEVRDAYLRENGYLVQHVNAADILRDPDEVAAAMVALAARALHHSPVTSGPHPRAGEDR